MQNNFDLIEKNETSKNSRGGTELLQERLYDGLVPRELLEQFQIVCSRVRELDDTKFRIFWAHDLPNDPESHFLANGGWNKFHRLVFVSNWQMQAYVQQYSIPWSMCEVVENSIYPIEVAEKPTDKIHICYTPTPHRGLNILYSAFDALSRERDDVVLDVFSSFKLYGWEQRDEQFKHLFSLIDDHPAIVNHGTKTNEEIRQYLSTTGHILAYPSVWPETSCLCLIEAMSAELMCIHSNYGALADTAAGFTHMYQMEEDESVHATKLFHILRESLNHLDADYSKNRLKFAKMYCDSRFNWNVKSQQWTAILSRIVAENKSKRVPGEMFVYNG